MARSDISLDRTTPGGDDVRFPGVDPNTLALDFIEMDAAERDELRKWALTHATKASKQEFPTEAAQREYLRLVDEFEQPKESFFDAKFFVGLAFAVAAGAAVGLIWRRHRKNEAEEAAKKKLPHIGGVEEEVDGFDSLGAE